MTVKKDLEKALAAAESAQGTYATFAASTDDQTAQHMFEQMSQDMSQHVKNIQSRLSTTAENQLGGTNAAATASSTTLTSATTSNQQEYL